MLLSALGCQIPTLTPLPPPPPGGYAETAKWFFTLLTSQASTGYTSSVFFLIKYTVYSIGLKYLQRNKVAYFGMQCVFVYIRNVTLEMKQITICLQWDLIFIRKPEKNY